MSTTTPSDPSQTPDELPTPATAGRLRFAVDVAERTLATYLEVLVSLLLVADRIGISTATAAAVAAVPAGLAVLKAGLSKYVRWLDTTRRRAGFVADLAERAVATYLESLVAFLAVADQIGVSTLASAGLAAIPAGLAVIKGGLARFLGDRESAALVPARLLTGSA